MSAEPFTEVLCAPPRPRRLCGEEFTPSVTYRFSGTPRLVYCSGTAGAITSNLGEEIAPSSATPRFPVVATNSGQLIAPGFSWPIGNSDITSRNDNFAVWVSTVDDMPQVNVSHIDP